jgi:CBS domain-containing protein
VYDYVAGKLDWIAAGLPSEGTEAEKPTAGSVANTNVARCSPDDTVADARTAARAVGIDVCAVVNDDGVLLGLLRADELEGPDDARVMDAMLPGPSTFRPHVPIAEMVEYMTEHDLDPVPVTTSDGKLVGLLSLDEARDLQDR